MPSVPGMIRTALNRSVYDAWAARVPEVDRPGYEVWAEEKIRTLVPWAGGKPPRTLRRWPFFLPPTAPVM